MSQLKLEDLSVGALQQIIELKLAMAEEEEEDVYLRLLELSTCLEGKKGKGKTMSAVVICYNLRERFDRHVITVGSKMGLNEDFGPFQNITEMEFRDILSKVQDIVEGESHARAAEDVYRALKKAGIDLMYATLAFDEAYKLFDARTPSDKLVRLFGYFMSQQRHYHCTTVLCTPNRQMVDKRVRDQVDWWGRCFYNQWTAECIVRLTAGLESMPLIFNSADDTYHIPYQEMYNSWSLEGFRRSHLNIKQT